MNAEQMRRLCINEGWFTMGNNRQYERLMRMAQEHDTLSAVASLIEICSDGVTLCEVVEKLKGAGYSDKR